jgi:hypothetical protein
LINAWRTENKSLLSSAVILNLLRYYTYTLILSYLQKTVSSEDSCHFVGKAKILDSQREVLGLHKANHVFPIQITVTKTSGSGADSVFLGILKV